VGVNGDKFVVTANERQASDFVQFDGLVTAVEILKIIIRVPVSSELARWRRYVPDVRVFGAHLQSQTREAILGE